MYILPAPPYPGAPKPSGITVGRAWFLYGVAGFTKAQITTLTGVPRPEVERAVLSSLCTQGDQLRDSSAQARTVLTVMRMLGLRKLRGVAPTDRSALRRALRHMFAMGLIPWKAVDALPLPEEITADQADILRANAV